MSFPPGSRVGVYEIISQIGAGGMGEVYRARDSKLNREVALKVLPESFAHDAERLARIRREAQTLASLNHPHIAQIYGLEESSGTFALVMELVEGDDLSQRLARGPVPLDEALPIARQIAEALEAAHEQGIVHRDLKPANIKVKADGTVKVLDFGLAKAIETGAGNREPGAGVANAPTITSPAMTRAGVIMGTAAYMAPEQAKGRPVDRRADIWAFGCVLYEMLTARRAFGGDDITDTLTAIMRDAPAWDALPATTPQPIRALMERCLTKEARARLQAIGEARIAVERAIASPESSEAAAAAGESKTAPPAVRPSVLPWAVAASLATALAATLLWWSPWRAAPSPQAVRVTASLGVDASLQIGTGATADLALSPDGKMLAFSAQGKGSGSQLFVRRLDSLDAVPLAGAAGASNPFFSPDGQWIAFFASGSLKKIAVNGGAAITLADAATGRGGAWADDGTIVFQPRGGASGPLQKVSAAGGVVTPLNTLDPGEVTARWPQVLPGGRGILYTSHTGPTGFDEATLVVQPLPTGNKVVVHRGGYFGRYLPTGHLAYLYKGTLFAKPFDVERLLAADTAVPVIQRVSANESVASAQLAWSDSGTMVYMPGEAFGNNAPVDWLDRAGKVTPLRTTLANWSRPRFSPDGRFLAMNVFDKQFDVWVYDTLRNNASRLTFANRTSQDAIWTPNGQRLVFSSARDGGSINLYWQRADGTGEIQRLTDVPRRQVAGSWHPDGKLLALAEFRPQTNDDIVILPMEGDEAKGWKPGTPTDFLSSPNTETQPMFSPDGRFLAYVSVESGRGTLYVRSFPGPGGPWEIGAGTDPAWSRAGRELLYRTLDSPSQIMAAAYTVEGTSFRPETARPWSPGRIMPLGSGGYFDLHPDGTRVAAATPVSGKTDIPRDHVVFIFNFFDELRRLGPTAK